MDIFRILQEAKNPSSNSLTVKVKEDTATDYTEDESIIEQENDTSPETEEESQEDETTEDTTVDSEEETEENPEDDEATDYTEDIGGMDDSGSDDGSEDSSADDYGSDSSDQSTEDMTPEEKEDTKKNALLIKNTIDLYYSITSVISRFDKLSNTDVNTNKVIIQVKSNLTDLTTKLYDFITNVFNNNTYVKNLYIYNYFIEAYKINIEILRKITTLTNLS